MGALAVTIALHVGAVIVLFAAFHRDTHLPSSVAFVSTLILLPAATRRPETPERSKSSVKERLAPLRPIEPPPFEPGPITPSFGDGAAIDWIGEGREAVAFEAQKMTGHESGAGTADDGKRNTPESGRAHTAGEQYRTDTGDSIVWISDRCYVISENVPPGTPQSVARSKPSRTVCPGESREARGDLFKDLPAYRKRHPL